MATWQKGTATEKILFFADACWCMTLRGEVTKVTSWQHFRTVTFLYRRTSNDVKQFNGILQKSPSPCSDFHKCRKWEIIVDVLATKNEISTIREPFGVKSGKTESPFFISTNESYLSSIKNEVGSCRDLTNQKGTWTWVKFETSGIVAPNGLNFVTFQDSRSHLTMLSKCFFLVVILRLLQNKNLFFGHADRCLNRRIESSGSWRSAKASVLFDTADVCEFPAGIAYCVGYKKKKRQQRRQKRSWYVLRTRNVRAKICSYYIEALKIVANIFPFQEDIWILKCTEVKKNHS